MSPIATGRPRSPPGPGGGGGRSDVTPPERVLMERQNVTDEFDPYRQWLGFPAGRLPQDYYELFRLERFEPDLKLIAREADIVIAEVRRIRPGRFAAQWAALLDELCTAKACLTDARRKAEYDARLRAQGSPADLAAESKMPSAATDSAAASRPSSAPTAGRTVGTAPSVETSPLAPTPDGRPAAMNAQTLYDNAEGYRLANRDDARPISAASNRLRLNWLDVAYRTAALGFVMAAVILAGALISRRDAVRSYLRDLLAMRDPSAVLGASSDPMVPGRDTVSSTAGPVTSSQGNATDPPPANPATEPAATTSSADTPRQPPAADTPASTVPIGAADSAPAAPSPVVQGEPLPPVAGPASAPFAAGAQATSDPETAPSKTSDGAESAGDVGELSGDFRATARQVWQAMAARDLVKARETLNGLASQVRRPPERTCVTALDALLMHLEEFWRGVTQATASLRSTEELPIGETMVIVVEADRERIVVRAAGRNRTYAVREMPTALVRAVVEQRFQKGPDTQILLGAFLAVDPKGDPAEARRLWQAAKNSGADVGLLMEALDYAPDGGPVETASRMPIPGDGGELAQSRQWVESQFPAAYQDAPTIPVKADAARKMLEAARDSALNDEAVRYLLLREAARLAVEAGEARLALQSVEELGARYAVDLSHERRTVAESLSQSPAPASLHQRVASELLEAVQAALTSGDRDAAQALASAAVISARKARNAALLRQAITLLQSAGGNP